MSAKKRSRVEAMGEIHNPYARRDIETKKELARRLMEGKDVEKDEEKAVDLLEDCVAFGDAEAMLMLGKCCALGCGTKKNARRAYDLIYDSFEGGNDEAESLLCLIDQCKGKRQMNIQGLIHGECAWIFLFSIFFVMSFLSELIWEFSKEECTDQEGFDPYFLTGAYILMNVIPFKSMKMGRMWISQRMNAMR